MADAMLCPDPCTWVVVRRGGTYAVVRCARCGARRTGPTVESRHFTRAEAEAAVDERLRADGVVLP